MVSVKLGLVFFIVCSLQAAQNVELNHLSKNVRAGLSIINGNEAQPYQAPFVVAIRPITRKGSTSLCGGSLISSRYVLTAAHCVYGYVNAMVDIAAFWLPRKQQGLIHFDTVKSMHYYEYYSPERFTDDIALIELPSPVSESKYVKYAKLPSRGDYYASYVNNTARVYGWGLINDHNQLPRALEYVDITVIDKEHCLSRFANFNDRNLCAGGLDGKKICGGDSGGPLVLGDTVIGIVSYGSKTCANYVPDAYVKVSKFLNWIEANSDVVIH